MRSHVFCLHFSRCGWVRHWATGSCGAMILRASSRDGLLLPEAADKKKEKESFQALSTDRYHIRNGALRLGLSKAPWRGQRGIGPGPTHAGECGNKASRGGCGMGATLPRIIVMRPWSVVVVSFFSFSPTGTSPTGPSLWASLSSLLEQRCGGAPPPGMVSCCCRAHIPNETTPAV